MVTNIIENGVSNITDNFEDTRIIPKTMSTQHPDNATTPEWTKEEVIDGNEEVFEAFYSFNRLGCQEVMWDSEGKDVDTRVVRKLLQKHWNYFSENVIGEDVYLTYRIPNPKIEGAERKYVVETLQNIPVAHDVASLVYKREVNPIFEVILPFTTNAKELIMLLNYYKKSIIADEDITIYKSTTTRDWIGDFKPKAIKIIPLVEDFDSILHVDRILNPYIKFAKPKNLRVFIARSDPALNYGLICAVLLTKIGLTKLLTVEEKNNVKIHPILGVGSRPFRGHLSPENIDNFLEEYQGISTVTLQSAFRYDYPIDQVKESIRKINKKLPNGNCSIIEQQEQKILIGILQKCRFEYENVIETLAPFINSISMYVPQRRARKLHIGLFGYSRCVSGIHLPRAISFASSLYTIGLPPEFIGMKSLTNLNENEWRVLQKYYVHMESDLKSIGQYFSWKNMNFLKEVSEKISKKANLSEERLSIVLSKILIDIKTVEEIFNIKLGPESISQRMHENFTNNFLLSYINNDDIKASKALMEAAKLRKCLG